MTAMRPRRSVTGVKHMESHPHGVSMSDPLDSQESYIPSGASSQEHSLYVARCTELCTERLWERTLIRVRSNSMPYFDV